MKKLLEFQEKVSLLSKIEKIFYGFISLILIIFILNKAIKYDTLISTFVGGAFAYLFSYLMEFYKEKNRNFDKIKNFLLALEVCLRNVSVTRITLIDQKFIEKNHVYFPQLDIKNYFDDLLGILENQDYMIIMQIKKIIIEIDSHIKWLERINNEILKKYILEEKIINLSSPSSYQSFKESQRDNILRNTNALLVLIKVLYPHIEAYLKEKFPSKALPVVEWEKIIEGLGGKV